MELKLLLRNLELLDIKLGCSIRWHEQALKSAQDSRQFLGDLLQQLREAPAVGQPPDRVYVPLEESA